MKIKFVSLFVLLFIFLISSVFAGNFTSTWNTASVSFGSTNSTTISLPLESSGDYDFVVYWGDGNSSVVTAWNSANKTHTYGVSGIYEIDIVGKIHGFRINNQGDREKLINITGWGGLLLGNSGNYFQGATNFVNITAGDVNLSGVSDFNSMFHKASNFNGDIGSWNVSGATNMNSMFGFATAFNRDIGDWDVSGVTDMGSMFNYASAFNQDIGDWDVGRVTQIGYLFGDAPAFNQNLTKWRVCQVTNRLEYDGGASAWSSANKPKWNEPCVKSVDSVEGNYLKGGVVNIVIEFSENVSVTGVPKLELRFDGGNKNATYVSGSGTTNLTFRYVVQSGDVANRLDYVGVNSLKLDGGVINATDDGNDAVLTLPSRDSLKSVKNVSVMGGVGVFTTTWNTSATNWESSNSNQIRLPLYDGGDYDFTVYWGDGSSSEVTAWNSANKTHTYGSSGIYTINIIGKLDGFRFNYKGDRLKLINISSWGGVVVG